MFSNLTYQDKEAFFSLLDEYFESRPHLTLPGATPNESAITHNPPPVTSGRSLPPPAPRSNGPPAPISPPPSVTPGAKPDFASRLVSSSIKYGGSGLGKLASNNTVNDALGRAGASAITRGLNDKFGGTKSEDSAAAQAARPEPPAPTPRKGVVSGLTSSKSFGHVDTSSKMSAFTTMFRDPQKPQAPTANVYVAPALASHSTALPPPRRGNQSTAAQNENESLGAEGQAQALYDYQGGDSTDLPVQSGQIVNVIEKTSADWWMCEDGNGTQGLVPATYLKEI